MKQNKTMAEQVAAARKVGVPIIAIETIDPSATMVRVTTAIDQTNPVFEWDCVRAVTANNAMADAVMPKVFGETEDERMLATANPVDFLRRLRKRYPKEEKEKELPNKSVVFIHNAHRMMEDTFIMQGIWNVRDLFKKTGCTLILLCSIVKLPTELQQDVIVISDALPDRDELLRIMGSVLADAKGELPENPRRALEFLCGLGPFSSEQTVSLSIEKVDKKKPGINMDVLWDVKCSSIRQIDGLQVHEGPENFKTLGGCQNAKEFFIRLQDSPDRPSALMLIDEIEKQVAGATGIGDSSGTSQDQLGCLLTTMQDKNLSGWLEFGVAGAAKTAFVKALANELGIPLLLLDLGATKASLVGESERKIRQAMKVFLAVSNGKGMVVGTCNKYINLPPELRRRFSNGMWYFGLPDSKEQEIIWKIYLEKYDMVGADLSKLDYKGWTGAEIKACVETAWRFKLTLDQAARYIVPVVKSAPEVISQMRDQAHNKFISASKPGLFMKEDTFSADASLAGKGREINL